MTAKAVGVPARGVETTKPSALTPGQVNLRGDKYVVLRTFLVGDYRTNECVLDGRCEH